MPSLSAELQSFSAVVVTGGSSGIGKSFIELLHTVQPRMWFCNLSRSAPITSLAELKLRHFPCDFENGPEIKTAVEAVSAFLTREVPDGRVLLINNSGFGTFGRFLDTKTEEHLGMVDVNVRAPIEITARLLPFLLSRGGGIINIASVAGFQPTPLIATYGATKSFLLHWSLALGVELRGSNLHVLTSCPGPTTTGFAARAGLRGGGVSDFLGQTPGVVVEEILRAWARRRPWVIHGWKNRLAVFFVAFASKPLVSRAAFRVIRRAVRKR